MLNRIIVVAVGLAIGAVACVPGRYRPTLPMRAQSGDVQLELERLQVAASKEFVFRSRAKASWSMQQGWLTEPSRPPCSGGLEASAFLVNGQAGSTVAAGEHELRIKFPGGIGDLNLDLVVDLRLADGACARAPAISQSVPMAAPNRFIFISSWRLDGGQDLRGLRAAHGLRLGGGGWFGRVLLSAEAGAAWTICNADTCGKDDRGELKTGSTFPLTVDARYSFVDSQRSTAASGLDWSLGVSYSFFPVRLPAPAGRVRFGVHGIHVAPGVVQGFFPGPRSPLIHMHRAPALEYVIPVGILIDPAGPSRKLGFSIGAGMRLLLPI